MNIYFKYYNLILKNEIQISYYSNRNRVNWLSLFFLSLVSHPVIITPSNYFTFSTPHH